MASACSLTLPVSGSPFKRLLLFAEGPAKRVKVTKCGEAICAERRSRTYAP